MSFIRRRLLLVVCFILLASLLAACFRAAPPQPVQEEEALSPQSIILTQPANGGALSLGSDISVTFNESMERTSVERAISIFSGVYDPSKNPATFTALQLTSMCNGRWRVRNPNTFPLSFNWDIYLKQDEKGVGVVPASSDVFFTTSPGSRTVRLFVGTTQQQVKATNPAACKSEIWTSGWSADDKTATFTPKDILPANAPVTVVLSTLTQGASGIAKLSEPYILILRKFL